MCPYVSDKTTHGTCRSVLKFTVRKMEKNPKKQKGAEEIRMALEKGCCALQVAVTMHFIFV